MKKYLLVLASCTVLAGCAQYNVTLMSQNSGNMWHGTANEMGKTVTIELKGETYKGNYSFIQNGSVGFGTGFIQGIHPSGSAFANSTYFTQAAAGNGTVIAASASGKGLRCQFSYSSMSRSGAGICSDDAKKLYDLLIN